MTAPIHLALAAKDLSPKTHLVDTGYLTADLLVSSDRWHGIHLLGPVRGDHHRQARERKGFAASDFEVDWEKQMAHCPAGCVSSSWTMVLDVGQKPNIKIKFSGSDYSVCVRRCRDTGRGNGFKKACMSELEKIYAARFEGTGIEKRQRVWRLLCSEFFSKPIPAEATVLDLACGYGEFINNIQVREKYAIDLNPDAPSHVDSNVHFFATAANELGFANDDSVDVVFTSNFLEHLPDKQTCSAVMLEVKGVLRPGGRFMILGPHIRFAHRDYWDY